MKISYGPVHLDFITHGPVHLILVSYVPARLGLVSCRTLCLDVRDSSRWAISATSCESSCTSRLSPITSCSRASSCLPVASCRQVEESSKINRTVDYGSKRDHIKLMILVFSNIFCGHCMYCTSSVSNSPVDMSTSDRKLSSTTITNMYSPQAWEA